MLQTLGGYILNVIGAVIILIIGWIIAAIVAALVRRLLRRMHLDDRVGRSMSETGEPAAVKTEYWISRAVFWLIMLCAFVAALQTLNLTLITTAFTELLNQVLAFLPRLAAAAIVFLIAWFIATVLRFAVSRGLRAVHFDERIANERAAQAGTPGTALPAPGTTDTSSADAAGATTSTSTPTAAPPPVSPTNALANAVYWLVFFLFLPGILGALQVEGLLAPVEQLVTEVLLFVPNLLAAGVILVVGWFCARIIQRIVVNLAAGIGVDRLGNRIGLSAVLGPLGLSGLLGLVVYILVLVPIIIAALNALQIPAVTVPASAMLTAFLNAIPTIFAAALLIGISYVVGRVVAHLATELLTGIGFNTWLARMHIWTPPAKAGTSAPAGTAKPGAGAVTPADVVGYLILLGVILFATIAALNMLGFALVATLVSQFTLLVGQIILGLIIFAIGLVLSNLAARAIVASQIARAGLLALTARVAIIVLAGAMALRQMGLANEIVNLAFGLLLGALAVAFALAFGLGGRQPAQREVERLFQALHAPRIGGEPPSGVAPQLDVRPGAAEQGGQTDPHSASPSS